MLKNTRRSITLKHCLKMWFIWVWTYILETTVSWAVCLSGRKQSQGQKPVHLQKEVGKHKECLHSNPLAHGGGRKENSVALACSIALGTLSISIANLLRR